MSALTNPAWWAVIVAVISAGIAVAAILVARATAQQQSELARQQTELVRKQTELQEQMTAIETSRRAEELQERRRADVRVATFPFPGKSSGTYTLRLFNMDTAAAAARNVRFDATSLDGLPLEIHGLEQLPVAVLRPDEGRDFTIYATYDSCRRFGGFIYWTDDAGDHKEPFDLSLF